MIRSRLKRENKNPSQYNEGKRQKHSKKYRFKVIKEKLKEAYDLGGARIKKNIRLEILWLVGISFIVSSLTFFIVSKIVYTTTGEYQYSNYDESRENVESSYLETVKALNALQGKPSEYINIDELYNMMEQEEVNAITNLQEYLNEITGNQFIFADSPSSTAEDTEKSENNPRRIVTQLYRSLYKLEQNGQWDEETVSEIITDFFKQNNIDIQKPMLKKAKEEINDLKSSIGSWSEKADVYLVDSTGQLTYSEGYIEKLDLVKIIQSVNSNEDGESSYKSIYPVIINGQVYYLFAEATLEQLTYHDYDKGFGNIIGFIAAVGMCILLMTRLTKDKIAYIEYLSSCLGEIAKGDLSYKIEVIGEDELAQVANNITVMEHEIQAQIEAQIQTEKAKNELVTNVAHDLRTPLTSIIGYIGLVKDKRYTTEEEHDKYLDIAYDKSEKLKVIIEDLFELTKLHQNSVELNKEIISISSLLNQLVEELMPLADEKNIEVQTYIEPTIAEVLVDVSKITRVFENLVENAIKYSEEGSSIYIELKEFTTQVYVAVSNHCDNIPQEEVDKFFERFYRADKSRNSQAGGSGLGLAIAKNIVELHGGKINAKVNGDLISFKVGLPKLQNQ